MFASLLLALALVQQTPAPDPDTTPPSPPIGRRTTTPEQMVSGMGAVGVAPDAGTEEPEVAAAAAYPLGSRENPVRVGGPEGERAYLARLRCADGSSPRIGVTTPDGVGAFGSMVDRYSVDCGTAAPGRADVLLDPYHEEHRETRAPTGFTLAEGS